MKEHFVTYEQALALKELGFDEPCWCYFVNDVFFDSMFPKDYDYFEQMNKKMEYTLAPLKSQVFKWFRDEHQLNCKIEFDKFITEDADDNELENPYFTYLYSINELWINGKDFFKFQNGWNNITSKREFLSFEEAESACIDKLISILKERKA